MAMDTGEEIYYFESLTKCEDELVKKYFQEKSIHRDLGMDILVCFFFNQINLSFNKLVSTQPQQRSNLTAVS